jgi:hypothetical protein
LSKLTQAEVAWTLVDESVSDTLGDVAEKLQALSEQMEKNLSFYKRYKSENSC